jgi:hypothetical protein
MKTIANLHTCLKCKGTKTLDIKITTYGKPGMEVKTIKCVYCDGTGKMTDKQIAQFKAEQEMWCRCSNPSGERIFYDDGEHPQCSKHCWACADCNKIVQVG